MKQHTITHHTVPRETFQKTDVLVGKKKDALKSYTDSLLWWNKRINLISRDVSRETISQHIRHSLLLTQFEVFKKSGFMVDAGTGGGLPGIPLAITSPSKNLVLNDIVSKKVLAIKDMARKLRLSNIETVGNSVAEITLKDSFLLISKHAFKINNLYHLTSHLPWTAMAFYKGDHFEEELNDIDTSLNISVYDLFECSQDDFYKHKTIIIATR